jgi:hypothetical protein
MEGGEDDNEMMTAMGIGSFGKQKKKVAMGPPEIIFQEEGSARPMVSFR